MAKTTKGILLKLLFAVVLVVGLMPMAAFAENESTESEPQEQAAEDSSSVQEDAASVQQSSDSTTPTDNEVAVQADTNDGQTGYWVYVYVKVGGNTDGLVLNSDGYYTIGKVFVPGISNPANHNYTDRTTTGDDFTKAVAAAMGTTLVRYSSNTTIDLNEVEWAKAEYGLVVSHGAADYPEVSDKENTWHLDGYVDVSYYGNVTINHIYEDTNTTFKKEQGIAKEGTSYNYQDYVLPDTDSNLSAEGYTFDYANPETVVVKKKDTVTLNLYYKKKTGSLVLSKQVEGSASNRDEHFTFKLSCASLAGKSFNASIVGNTGDADTAHSGTVSFGGNGVATVQLKHGETLTILGLPAGCQVSAQEVGISSNNAYVSASANGKELSIGSDGTTSSVSATVEAGNGPTTPTTIAFVNSANIAPDEGVAANAAPMAVLFAVSGAAALALLFQRMWRKKRGSDVWKG